MKTTKMNKTLTVVVRLVCVFGIAGDYTTAVPQRTDTHT